MERGKMKRIGVILCIVCGCLLSAAGLAAMTGISYETEYLGAGRWQYTYEVINLNLVVDSVPSAIEEFTIWFDTNLYDHLIVTTQAPLSANWDEMVWQPDPLLSDPGAYDALALTSNSGIQIGQSVYGFSVSFDWLGQGTPGSQYYEIINPDTFETIDSGYTVPEPGSVVLLGLGAVALRRKK
jgi:hypothetical protein